MFFATYYSKEYPQKMDDIHSVLIGLSVKKRRNIVWQRSTWSVLKHCDSSI